MKFQIKLYIFNTQSIYIKVNAAKTKLSKTIMDIMVKNYNNYTDQNNKNGVNK